MISVPRLDGVLETALYVDDLERSARFYQTLFGFELIETDERQYAMSVAGRQVLLLCKKRASADLPVRAHDGDGRLHLAFAVPAGELDAWEIWLRQHSVLVEDKRAWASGGRSLYFRDPDGHVVGIFEK